MTRRAWSRIAVLTLIAGLAASGGRPQAQTAQTGPPTPEQRARTVVDHLSKQEFAAVTAGFNATMQAAVSVDQLRAGWAGTVQQSGAFRRAAAANVDARGSLQIVVVTCDFERGSIDVQVVYDAAGLIAGLSMRPSPVPYAPPAYANASLYTEEDTTIGSGDWVLPATLTIPTGAGPFPGVVLVHGSGPNDRDETLGPNKPFKDLALGLASRGIAVLRFDKRTKVYGAKVAALGTFTVKEESVDDALQAAARLRTVPRIDPARIVVLGHSLGGTLIPRIGAGDARLAGLVVMAGAVQELPDAMLRQSKYLAMADGAISPEEQRQIDGMQKLVDAVKTLAPGAAASQVPISGAPASYWLDLRGYDPPKAATSLAMPMLILQGERDYQVTMDDFGKWKAALGGASRVTFHSYPALNHLFIAGTGLSLPAEYLVTGHVDAAVVRDMAEWIGKLK